MSLYDPLGFMAPLIVQLKLVMREIAGNDIGWDDDIPVQCWEKFKTAMFELLKLVDFKIPRAVCNSEFPDTPNADLVTFTDASSVAMCALVYLVVEHNGCRYPSLVLSKTKIAPQPQPTVPKMELLAASLGARMADQVSRALTNVKICNKFYLTDSAIVLLQLNKNSVQKDVFTTARIYEILTKSESSQWQHINSDLNVSDLGT